MASRVAEISGDSNASDAAWFVAPSIVVHWPTPWLATTEEGSAELSKLKGEFEALEQAVGIETLRPFLQAAGEVAAALPHRTGHLRREADQKS